MSLNEIINISCYNAKHKFSCKFRIIKNIKFSATKCIMKFDIEYDMKGDLNQTYKVERI